MSNVIQADREAADAMRVDAIKLRLGEVSPSRIKRERELIAAAHREAERDRIVAWLREDADRTEVEARNINKNTTGDPRKLAAEWAQMIAMKRGIANAIEKGAHHD